MTGAVGGVLRFGIGAFFKTGTTIDASDPRALGSTALVLALEVAGLVFPVVGGLSIAGFVGLAGKLEAFTGGVTTSEFPAFEFAGGEEFGLVCGVSGLVGTTSGFAGTGFVGLLELGWTGVFEICGFGAVANVGSLAGVLELGLVAVLELGGLTGLLLG
jgi:hypothetical protein